MAMLDDFLLVSPRKPEDTDEDTLARGRKEGALFDSLLKELNLPPAVEKSQPASFSTVWCGVEYFSKTRYYGAPRAKWENLRAYFLEHILSEEEGFLKTVEAGKLQTLLGKLCHYMTVWAAGRPCLLYL